MIKSIIEGSYHLERMLEIFHKEIEECKEFELNFISLSSEALKKINNYIFIAGINSKGVTENFLRTVRYKYNIEDIYALKGDIPQETFKTFVGYYSKKRI